MSSQNSRPSLFPQSTAAFTSNLTSTSQNTSYNHGHAHAHAHSASASHTNRARQYSHLHAQLAQLNAHLADTENLLRMTAVQAEYMRGLGGFCGGLFMASAKVLGEETVAGSGMAAEVERGRGEVERRKAEEASMEGL